MVADQQYLILSFLQEMAPIQPHSVNFLVVIAISREPVADTLAQIFRDLRSLALSISLNSEYSSPCLIDKLITTIILISKICKPTNEFSTPVIPCTRHVQNQALFQTVLIRPACKRKNIRSLPFDAMFYQGFCGATHCLRKAISNVELSSSKLGWFFQPAVSDHIHNLKQGIGTVKIRRSNPYMRCTTYFDLNTG